MKTILTLICCLHAWFCLYNFSAGQNVGIGTSTPAEKLHVAGNLRADFLSGTGNRLVGVDANGSLFALAGGNTGDVLVQTLAGPAWTTSPDWSLTGNSGTSPTTQFVGTTDAAALAFRTTNAEAMRITPDGLVCINGTGPFAVDRFSVYASGTQFALNGYASGTGAAGYFENSGGGNGIDCRISGSTGIAGAFSTIGAMTSSSPVVYVYNGSATNNALYLRSDMAAPTANGIYLDINGASSHRGMVVDMDAATTGAGVSILQYGNGYGLTIQNFSTANSTAGLLVDHAGTGRVVEGKGFNANHSSQVGFFYQASTGLTPMIFNNATAVWGQTLGIRGGAFVSAGQSTSNTCLQALYNGPSGNFDGIGVLGIFNPAASYGYGVVGQGGWYGLFANGNSGASGLKTFLIDHPADPENKYLRHFSMESNEVLNLYRGAAVLDANGRAVVSLPDYFLLVNKDFSYQLTPVGAAADVFVASEIDAAGEFSIAGGHPGQKICWTVFAVRNDAYVQQHQDLITNEPAKRETEKGLYLHPELFGKPAAASIFDKNKVRPEEVKPNPAQELPAQLPSSLPALPKGKE